MDIRHADVFKRVNATYNLMLALHQEKYMTKEKYKVFYKHHGLGSLEEDKSMEELERIFGYFPDNVSRALPDKNIETNVRVVQDFDGKDSMVLEINTVASLAKLEQTLKAQLQKCGLLAEKIK